MRIARLLTADITPPDYMEYIIGPTERRTGLRRVCRARLRLGNQVLAEGRSILNPADRSFNYKYGRALAIQDAIDQLTIKWGRQPNEENNNVIFSAVQSVDENGVKRTDYDITIIDRFGAELLGDYSNDFIVEFVQPNDAPVNLQYQI